MEHSPPPNVEEDYKVWAKISYGSQEITVPCKIFLPKTVLDKPQIYIFPKHEIFNELPYLREPCSFKATLGASPDIEIEGRDVHISGGSIRHWEEGLEEGYLKIYPARLIVRRYKNLSQNKFVWFRVTPSIHLSPWDIREYDFDGSAKINHGERFKFELTDDLTVTFFNLYRWENLENNITQTFRELVGEVKVKPELNEVDIEKYVLLLDDFLLLVSLAEGQKCTVPQFNIYFPEQEIDVYRLDRSLPDISDKHSFHDFLVDTKDIENFLNQSWEKYRDSPHKDLIKSALSTITINTNTTIETRFLALFSSIETLILVYRKENKLEYIVSDNQEWNSLKNKLMHLIKSDEILKTNKLARTLMYENINGLNRSSLRHALSTYVKENELVLNDLWPFSSDNGDFSLTKIRNHLVHGNNLSEQYIDSFIVACKSLELYAERLVLNSIDWNFNKSNAYVKDESFIRDWKDAIKVLNRLQV